MGREGKARASSEGKVQVASEGKARAASESGLSEKGMEEGRDKVGRVGPTIIWKNLYFFRNS